MIQIGTSSAGFYGRMETEEAAAYLTRFPVDACEIFLETHSEYSAAFGLQVRGALHGLECVSVHPKGTQFEPDLFGQSKRQIADALNIFENVCRAGEALGAKYYVFHGPNSPVRPMALDNIREMEARMGMLMDVARAHGIQILWENVSWCAVRTPADVRRLRERLPEIGFVLDVKQAYRAQTDPLAMIDAMGDRLRHIHVLDWDDRGNLTLPGQGVMDWRAMAERLRAIGYDGAVILEPYPAQTADEDAVRQSIAFLREVFVSA